MDAAEIRLEITPARAVERLEEGLGLSANELSAALDVAPRTLERWRAGETHPQRDARRRLAALISLDDHLRETFEDSEAGRKWMHASNRYLGGLTATEVLRVGRVDRVEAALEALDSGVFV